MSANMDPVKLTLLHDVVLRAAVAATFRDPARATWRRDFGVKYEEVHDALRAIRRRPVGERRVRALLNELTAMRGPGGGRLLGRTDRRRGEGHRYVVFNAAIEYPSVRKYGAADLERVRGRG